jgi:hypothetical protein
MLWPPSRSKPCLVDPRTRSLGGHRRHPSVRLRRRVRSGKAPAGDRGLPMPAPRPPEGGSLLLCRPEPRREEARQPRKAATPRPEDEVFRPEHLDRTHNGVRVLGLWLRGGAGEGLDRDAPEGAGARGTGQPRASLPIVVGTLVLVEVERLREPQVLWLWWHGPEGAVPDLDLLSLEGLCSPLRSGAHLPLPQAKLRVERPARTPSRASRPVDVAGGGRFHPAQAGAGVR